MEDYDVFNDPFMLYLDKVKGDNYLDWVTGRPFIMEDFGKDFLLSLSNIKISAYCRCNCSKNISR